MKILPKLLATLALLAFPPEADAHDSERHAGAIMIEKAWARKTSRTVSAAAYMSVKNTGHETDELLDAESPIARTTMIHRSYEEDGIMKMDHMEAIALSPGETVDFAPGGFHIMLMGLEKPLEKGDVFPVTLTFQHAGKVQVIVEVSGMMGPQ
ncbi:MAG: copper chaperone PCu(A)C [Alphaproteobacteria bacterium]|nr:copper chaperone PCu(A)C [Alphaproteobacteria bacterium]